MQVETIEALTYMRKLAFVAKVNHRRLRNLAEDYIKLEMYETDMEKKILETLSKRPCNLPGDDA